MISFCKESEYAENIHTMNHRILLIYVLTNPSPENLFKEKVKTNSSCWVPLKPLQSSRVLICMINYL